MSSEAFSTRELRPASRRALAVAVTLAVMALAAGGVWAAWRMLGHRAEGGGVPVIHADARPVKVPPRNPGGLDVPDENYYVLNGTEPSDSPVEQLLPSPETPLPRPTPPAPPAATQPAPQAAAPAMPTAPAPATASAPPAPAPAPMATVAHPSATAPTRFLAAQPQAEVGAVAIVPPPKPSPAPVTPATTEAPPAAAGYRLQIGALRSAAEAQEEWNRLRRTQPEILGRLDERTVRVDLGERGTFYRLEAGPIAAEADAERACALLKERKVGCILVKP